MITKGLITKTDGIYATIISFQNEVFDDVLLVYPYGFQSKVKPTESTLVLLLSGLGKNLFAIPYEVATQSILEDGEVEIRNRVSKLGFIAKKEKNLIEGDIDCNKTINATAYKVNNVKVVGIQQPTISNPAGGAIIDAESRVTIASIITALKNHGLIA